MSQQLVSEWLTDYGSLSPNEVHSFATELEHDQELVTALHNVLEERNKHIELIDPVCNQLFSFYRSREQELQRFTLQFLPTLIYAYLNTVAHGDKKNCRSVETLLIGLYNLEVVDENGQSRVMSFRLPSLAQASIYHEPISLAPASLTESALRRLEECNIKLVCWGPLPQVEALNTQNRLKVMTALLFVYNQQLSLLPKSALQYLCKVASKLVRQGFSKQPPGAQQRTASDTSLVPRLLPRVPVSSQLLLEFVHAVYYAMFNGCSQATSALDDLSTRANYECYPDVLLVTNAIRNSLLVNPSGQPCDGPMGISVALSPATTTVTVSKSMITNASFRTKKLPDDLEMDLMTIGQDDPVSDDVKELSQQFIKTEGSNEIIRTPKWRKGWGPWKSSSPAQTAVSSDDETSKTPSPGRSPRRSALSTPPSPHKSSTPTKALNRMSAGAKLCKVFEEQNSPLEEVIQTLFISGRPASVNLIQTSSNNATPQ